MEDEYLDIVDEKDLVVGRGLREDIYRKGLEKGKSIRVVNVFVFNIKNELLLPKRSIDRKIFPGCYDFSCGEHVAAGEEYEKAAYRGLEEELGITNGKLTEIGKLSPKEGVSSFMKVYALRYDEEITKWDREGIEKLCWYDLSTIEEMVKENPKNFKPDFPVVMRHYLNKVRSSFE